MKNILDDFLCEITCEEFFFDESEKEKKEDEEFIFVH